MAKSIPFEGANRRFVTPLVEPEDHINDKQDMFGYQNGIVTYTRWELTQEEIADICDSGEVWIAVRNGSQPMRSTWVGSFRSIKQQCVDYGSLWRSRFRPLEKAA